MDRNGNIVTGEFTEQENETMKFEPTIYNVYARVDEKNRVTKIFSDCFEQPNFDDVLLKSGSGDEFVHVGYYQVMDRDGTYKYKIRNGRLAERTEYDREEELYASDLKARINMLKQNLKDTDYQAIKHSEGLISDLDYAEMLNQRMEWREEINRLEAEQANLSE